MAPVAIDARVRKIAMVLGCHLDEVARRVASSVAANLEF
jgi:hypothetical protein